MSKIFLLHAFATAAMTGIIWLIQLVHYPMFSGLDLNSFSRWHDFHSRRISFIVVPLMVFELGASIASLFQDRPSVSNLTVLALTLGIWSATFFVSVPCHNRLAVSFDELTASKLTKTNWIRTGLYSVKLCMMLMIVFRSFSEA